MELEKATGKRNGCVRLQRPTREIELILKTISVGEAGVLGAEPLRFYGVAVCEFFTHGGYYDTPPRLVTGHGSKWFDAYSRKGYRAKNGVKSGVARD